MDKSISENIRKLIMAGIGAVSAATEKSQDVLEQLAQKGEEAVSQGKVLNEQLRHEVKQAVKEHVTMVERKPADKDGILSALNSLTPEERQEILDKLQKLSSEEKTDEQ